MRYFWLAKTNNHGAHYAVGSGDEEIVFIAGRGEDQAQRMALVIARALNANEAELYRLEAELDSFTRPTKESE
jgi:hypothetical protein